jgi:PhoPQ-activated pathogenicity-related protein
MILPLCRVTRIGLRLAFSVAVTAAALLPAADTARRGARETALDRYVAKPDPNYAWTKVGEIRDDSATAYAIEMISQHWLTTTEVNRVEWRHWVNIIKPDALEHSTALLFITGGSNRGGQPPKPPTDLINIAKATRSVVVELRMVPNQPLVFGDDGKPRGEDDLIAYTWDKFLRTGDERWPARLPMTKAAVRAMDTVTAFLASDAGGKANVDTFVVSGASKRGWTTWSTAIVDRRVVAICPMVIDVLNVETSMIHHYRAYGFYSPAVGDYVRHGIMEWMGTPESKALYAIEDPFSYRDRLSLPKLMLNSCGDQFFLPDSSQFYFDQLPGVKYLRYVPNTDHSLRNSDANLTLQSWHEATLEKLPLPQFSWKHEGEGHVTVTATTRPQQVMLWQATNPNARDFRLEIIGPGWRGTELAATGGIFRAQLPKPDKGWTAYMIELTFDIGGKAPLKLTTNIGVTPNVLPFAAAQVSPPSGFLTSTK